MSVPIKKFKGDIWLLLLVVLVSAYGVVAVYSASSYSALKDYNNPYHFAIKQLIGFFIGLIAMIIFANLNYKKLSKFSIIAYILGIVLLALIFVPKLGIEVYGAKRWLNLGFFSIQPSELAKFCYVLFVASYFSKIPKRSASFKTILPVVFAGLAVCLLIMLEPNMSITVCVVLLMFGLLFQAGVKIKYLAILVAPVILAIPVLIIIEPYRLKRLMAFINPWASPKGEGYQLLQSLYALGSGGLFGVGFFNSRQKYKFLPFAESDFILSVIGEEGGYIFLLLLFFVFALIIYKGFRAAANSKNLFGYYLASGITLIYSIQVIINALVVTGSIPPTGLPLPLISAGNTSLIVYMAAFGIVYNISADKDKLTI